MFRRILLSMLATATLAWGLCPWLGVLLMQSWGHWAPASLSLGAVVLLLAVFFFLFTFTVALADVVVFLVAVIGAFRSQVRVTVKRHIGKHCWLEAQHDHLQDGDREGERLY